MSNSKIFVNRYFVAILYEDDINYEKYLNNIKKKFTEVTYIKHDKDITDEGELKKTHIHILFKVGENARHLNAVAKDIDIPSNYLQGCNKTKMLRYLIHLDNPEKTQYSINEVQGELKKELKDILKRQVDEKPIYREIIRKIQENEIKNITTLVLYAINNNCLEEVKKMQYILTQIIKEHKKN